MWFVWVWVLYLTYFADLDLDFSSIYISSILKWLLQTETFEIFRLPENLKCVSHKILVHLWVNYHWILF